MGESKSPLRIRVVRVNSWLTRFWSWPGAHGLLSSSQPTKMRSVSISQCKDFGSCGHFPKTVKYPSVTYRHAIACENGFRCSMIRALARLGKRNMFRHHITTLALSAALMIGFAVAETTPAQSQDQSKPSTTTAPAKNDYDSPDSWLCRPGRKDACAVDLSTTVVAANGKLTRENWAENPKAPIDCFYVYPTVSNDPTPNSDMIPGPEEKNVVRSQFARFGSQCRLYAPMYRQVTLTALRAFLTGQTVAVDRTLPYNDVLDAWHYYHRHHNKGRGVVLIGHSQGSGVLTQLIRNEIDGKPVQSKIISALLLGK